MVISLASDHAGYETKQKIIKYLYNYTVDDLGCHSLTSVDYPIYSDLVCADILLGKSSIGILVCGTGIGMSMAANKFFHIRAALCKDVDAAIMTRKHNNANVLCIGANNTQDSQINHIVQAFLSTNFDDGRHTRRIEMFSK